MLTNPEFIGEQRHAFQHQRYKELRQERLEVREWCFRSFEQKRITVRLRCIFATSLTQRSVTSVFLTRPKEDNSAKSWVKSITTSVSENEERKAPRKKFSVLWAFYKTLMKLPSLSDTLVYTRSEGPQSTRSPNSMVIRPNSSLHNFNSNSEYYISPEHEIKTNLVSSCQSPTFEGR